MPWLMIWFANGVLWRSFQRQIEKEAFNTDEQQAEQVRLRQIALKPFTLARLRFSVCLGGIGKLGVIPY